MSKPFPKQPKHKRRVFFSQFLFHEYSSLARFLQTDKDAKGCRGEVKGQVLFVKCQGLVRLSKWGSVRHTERTLIRCAPVVRFKMKVFCPECGLRVQPSDVGEVREMRNVCRTMWRKFMQRLGI